MSNPNLAFPFVVDDASDKQFCYEGLTKLEYASIHVASGLLSGRRAGMSINDKEKGLTVEDVVKHTMAISRAILRECEKEEKK